MNSEISQAIGKMKPCHRPSRKPGAAGATAAALCVAQAASAASAAKGEKGARRGASERPSQAEADGDEDDGGDQQQRAGLLALAEAALRRARSHEHDQRRSAAKTMPMANLVVSTMVITSVPSLPLPTGDGGSLARQTLVIIGGLQLDLAQVGRVVGLDAAGEAGALHGLGAQIIKRF